MKHTLAHTHSYFKNMEDYTRFDDNASWTVTY